MSSVIPCTRGLSFEATHFPSFFAFDTCVLTKGVSEFVYIHTQDAQIKKWRSNIFRETSGSKPLFRRGVNRISQEKKHLVQYPMSCWLCVRGPSNDTVYRHLLLHMKWLRSGEASPWNVLTYWKSQPSARAERHMTWRQSPLKWAVQHVLPTWLNVDHT